MATRLRPITGNDKLIIDEDTGAVVGMQPDARTPAAYFPRTEMTPQGPVLVVVSEDAPSDEDGRPDGTIYIQTA